MGFLKEPLLHFLLIGVALFGAYDAINGGTGGANSREIVVDREGLLTFMQFRAKVFDPDRFDRLLDEMPADKLQTFIDEYVKEEALYREAKALNLDRNDYVARRRLIQQLEFITRGFVSVDADVTEEELGAYFQSHSDDYYKPAEITFTHVFFSREGRGANAARESAQQTLRILNPEQVPFDQALGYGDRFFYQASYEHKTAEFVASHFGEAMQQQIFELPPDEGVWHGPFTSPYGEHLVMVTGIKPGYQPKLNEVRESVAEQARRERLNAEIHEAFQSIVNGYDVKVAESLVKTPPRNEQG